MGTYPDLQGKRVLVTGGSGGIGRATAAAFTASGAVVTVLGNEPDQLGRVVQEGDAAHCVTADLCDDCGLAAAVGSGMKAMGGLDVLVNVGALYTEAMKTPGVQALREGFNLHVASAAAAFEAAKEELVRNKGAVVNVSSGWAIVPGPESWFAYSVAKAAQDHWTKGLAHQYAARGVRVNAVQPSVIRTGFWDELAQGKGMSVDEFMRAAGKIHGLQRVGEPREVAAVILFLASAAASFVTGVTMPVDGGGTLMFVANTGDAI